jgi:hypothetical protein
MSETVCLFASAFHLKEVTRIKKIRRDGVHNREKLALWSVKLLIWSCTGHKARKQQTYGYYDRMTK